MQPNRRKSLKQWLRSMRGQQILVTLVFLFVPLLLLVTFTYLPFFKMVQFSFFSMRYIGPVHLCRPAELHRRLYPGTIFSTP